MADIPTDREAIFTNPRWELVQKNLATQTAKVNAVILREGKDLGRTYVNSVAGTPGAIVGVPTNIGSQTMNLVGMDIASTTWDNVNNVTVNGTEYPEQITASIPAGKTMTINAGQRWLQVDEENAHVTFKKELADDVIAVDIAAGATLTLNADKSDNNIGGSSVRTSNMDDPKTDSKIYVPFALGGDNVALVTGSGTFNADMGEYGNNVFVQASKSNVLMGNGEGFYAAKGNSAQGHTVTSGRSADAFQYDFAEAGMPSTIGTNTFNGGVGSTDATSLDSIQLRNLPNGSKVIANVTAVRGSGTFKDSDVTLTIQNPQGATIGTIKGTDVSYVHIIYPDGSLQGFAPQALTLNTSKTYTIGATAPASTLSAERLALATRSLSGDESLAVQEASIKPVNIVAPIVTNPGVKIGG